MIRVLHCVHSMGRGGIETFIMNVYRCIDRNELQFDFLVTTDKECVHDSEILQLGGCIHHVPGRRQGIKKHKKAMDTFFTDHPEYGIIHFHASSLSNVSALRSAECHDVPTRIIHSHSSNQSSSKKLFLPLHRLLHLWNRRDVRVYATHYLACSEPAALWLYGKRQYERKEYEIIHNGTDVRSFRYDPERRKAVRHEHCLGDAFVIGHVGRFALSKNHAFLVEIFREVVKRCEGARLLLIGDGPLLREIEKKASHLGLSENVLFMGVRSDVPALLSAMDVFLMPSFYEGLSCVLVEAQAAGLPCVASTKANAEEVKMTEDFMFMSLDKSAAEWAGAVMNFIGRETDRTNGAAAVIEAGYDVESTVEKLEHLYCGNCK